MSIKKILDKIEKLIEQLPYKTVKIEVDMVSETLILEKERIRSVGFAVENIGNL